MSILDGMTVADLQARLTALQGAYLDLAAGARVVTASYSQGDGSRTVSYTQLDIAALAQTILLIQRQVAALTGTVFTARRPLKPYFRG